MLHGAADTAKQGSMLWPETCEQEQEPTFEVESLLFYLAFAPNGKYNVTSFSTWPRRTDFPLLNTKELFEHDIDMLIPPNLKLNKCSTLRLDEFLTTRAVNGRFCSSSFLFAFIWRLRHHLNIIMSFHESDVMWIANPILVIAREKSLYKQPWYFYNIALHWQSTQGISRCLTDWNLTSHVSVTKVLSHGCKNNGR